MPSTLIIALAGGLIASGVAGYYGYDYGVSSTLAEAAKVEAAKQVVIDKLEKDNAELDAKVLAAQQANQEVRTRTVVKYRDRVVTLPSRDCGFTPDERVLVRAGYCAAFPEHPDCMQAEVSTTPTTTRNQ